MVIKIDKITQRLLHFIFGQNNIPCVTITASMFGTMAFPVTVLHDLVDEYKKIYTISKLNMSCLRKKKYAILTCIPPLFSSVSKNGIHAMRVI